MSYESAMEKRILKTFKSKDNLIRKQQAEMDALKESIKEHDKWEKEEAIAFAVIKEEWRTQIIEKKAKVAELVDMLEELLEEYNDTYSPDELNRMDALIAKNKGECDD